MGFYFSNIFFAGLIIRGLYADIFSLSFLNYLPWYRANRIFYYGKQNKSLKEIALIMPIF